MANKLTEFSALILLFTPVFFATASVIVSFNMVDFIYLLLVGLIFLKYFIVKGRHWSFLFLFV